MVAPLRKKIKQTVPPIRKSRSQCSQWLFEFNFRSSNVEVAHRTTTDFDEWLHTPKALTVGGAAELEHGRSQLAGNFMLVTNDEVLVVSTRLTMTLKRPSCKV